MNNTKKPLATGLFIAGAVLLIAGMNSSRSATSQFSELFNNRPSKDTIFLYAAGLACVAAGAWSLRKK